MPRKEDMMKKSLVVFFCLAFFLVAQACDPRDEAGVGSAAEGSINILSVQPNTGLTENPTAFVVEVEYALRNTDQGELCVGFNNSSSVNAYRLITSAAVIVSEGSGEHTFSVTATPKDWGASGDFGAYVNISEHPHGSRWTPLDAEVMVLTF